jgi:hypothetical protein
MEPVTPTRLAVVQHMPVVMAEELSTLLAIASLSLAHYLQTEKMVMVHP